MATKNKLLNQKGFNLLEVMVSVGLFGLLATGVVNYFSLHQKDDQRHLLVEQRDALYKQVAQALVAENILYSSTKSYPGNRALADCINDAVRCPGTNSERQIPFQLFKVERVKGVEKFVRQAGTTGRPRFFNIDLDDEEPKGISLNNHPFMAKAFFWSTCPIVSTTRKPGNNCLVPELLNFRVQVGPSGPPTKGFELLRFGNVPPDEEFKGDANLHKHAITIPMTEIRVLQQQSCPMGTRLLGLDDRGRVKCECRIKGTEIYDQTTKRVTGCEQYVCKKNGRVIDDPTKWRVEGFDKKGNLICKELKGPPKPQCKNITVSKDSDCGEGAWMTSVVFGVCKPIVAGGKKPYVKDVSCSKDRATCCWLPI